MPYIAWTSATATNPTMRPMKIVVAIPALNEQATIGQVIQDLPRDVAGVTAMAPESFARNFSADAEPVRYPDPDIVTLDVRFNQYKIGNTPIQRIHIGNLWRSAGTSPTGNVLGQCEPYWCSRGL